MFYAGVKLSIFDRYLREVDFRKFLTGLDLPYSETLVRNVMYFTEKEAEKRDAIVKSYLGEIGISSIVNEVAENLQKLPKRAAILDVGAGTGFFTFRIAEKLANCDLSFYALDITPAMLSILAKKLSEVKNMSITPVLGIAERITESLNISRKTFELQGMILPASFDAVISILMLHHCVNPSEVFSSMRKAMMNNGRLILIDLCKHNFEEFKEELGDVHLGFKPDYIKSELGKMFSVERMQKMPHACKCKETGKSTDLFIAVAENRVD